MALTVQSLYFLGSILYDEQILVGALIFVSIKYVVLLLYCILVSFIYVNIYSNVSKIGAFCILVIF